MTRLTSLCILTSWAVLATTASSEEKPMKLFDGESLTGWTFFLNDPEAKMSDVWSVKDGLMICEGEPMGYIRTKKKFKNFKLTVEWRWAPETKPGNSGVLMRITGKPMFLPNCAEAQLKSGDAGDLYGFQGFKVEGPEDRYFEVKPHKLAGELRGVKKMSANENKPGEWNTYEIIANGGTIAVSVNGKKLNQATGCDVRAGHIGLQSEGGEIHFRKVELTPLGD